MHRAPGGRIVRLVVAAIVTGLVVGGAAAALVWAFTGLLA